MHFFVVIFFLHILTSVKSDYECTKTNNSPLKRLKDDLLCGYDKSIRPVMNKDNATVVNVKLLLKSITYNAYDHSFSMNNWMILKWHDEHLKWNPDDYDNIHMFHAGTDEIWIPDLSIYNRADESGNPGIITDINCIVSKLGDIICVPPGKHDSHCSANFKNYPFDVQNCTIRFGSWVYSGEEVDFKLDENAISLEDYIESGEWDISSYKVIKNAGHYNCCPASTFPSLNFNFVISRRSGVHICLTITPSIVLFLLTLISLSMDPEEMERLQILTCSIVCHTLFVQFLFWEIPISGADPPLIVQYLRDSLILAVSLLIITMIQRKLLKITSPSPLWVSTVVAAVINSRPGQFVFIFDNNLKGVANRLGEEDAANIVENFEKQKNSDWALFVKILDRMCFALYIIVFFVLVIKFVP